MKGKNYYIMAGVLLFFGSLLFVFGCNDIKMDTMSLGSILFGIASIAVYVPTQRNITLYSLVIVTLLVMMLLMEWMFPWLSNKMFVSQNFLKWTCIVFVVVGLQAASVPIFLNYSNILGLVFIFMEGVVGCLFFFVIQSIKLPILDNPFVTREFFWCTWGLASIALFEWGIAAGYYGGQLILQKEQFITEKEARDIEARNIEGNFEPSPVDFMDMNLQGEIGGIRALHGAYMVNSDNKPINDKDMGYVIVFVGVILIALAAFTVYYGFNSY